jgi:hypothetical protein
MMEQSKQYYSLALERDTALIENTLQRMRRLRNDKAILVTGGFHTQGITNILKEKGVSYVVICPNICQGDYDAIYNDRIAGILPAIDEFEEALADALAVPLNTGRSASAGKTREMFRRLYNLCAKLIGRAGDQPKQRAHAIQPRPQFDKRKGAIIDTPHELENIIRSKTTSNDLKESAINALRNAAWNGSKPAAEALENLIKSDIRDGDDLKKSAINALGGAALHGSKPAIEAVERLASYLENLIKSDIRDDLKRLAINALGNAELHGSKPAIEAVERLADYLENLIKSDIRDDLKESAIDALEKAAKHGSKPAAEMLKNIIGEDIVRAFEKANKDLSQPEQVDILEFIKSHGLCFIHLKEIDVIYAVNLCKGILDLFGIYRLEQFLNDNSKMLANKDCRRILHDIFTQGPSIKPEPTGVVPNLAKNDDSTELLIKSLSHYRAGSVDSIIIQFLISPYDFNNEEAKDIMASLFKKWLAFIAGEETVKRPTTRKELIETYLSQREHITNIIIKMKEYFAGNPDMPYEEILELIKEDMGNLSARAQSRFIIGVINYIRDRAKVRTIIAEAEKAGISDGDELLGDDILNNKLKEKEKFIVNMIGFLPKSVQIFFLADTIHIILDSDSYGRMRYRQKTAVRGAADEYNALSRKEKFNYQDSGGMFNFYQDGKVAEVRLSGFLTVEMSPLSGKRDGHILIHEVQHRFFHRYAQDELRDALLSHRAEKDRLIGAINTQTGEEQRRSIEKAVEVLTMDILFDYQNEMISKIVDGRWIEDKDISEWLTFYKQWYMNYVKNILDEITDKGLRKKMLEKVFGKAEEILKTHKPIVDQIIKLKAQLIEQEENIERELAAVQANSWVGTFLQTIPITRLNRLNWLKEKWQSDLGISSEKSSSAGMQTERQNPYQEYFRFLEKFGSTFGQQPIKEGPNKLARFFASMHNWFATNENDWASTLGEVRNKEGVYLGVGFAGVNLSRLCHGNFDRAIIFDVNPYVTEVFMPIRAALISMSESRAEYLGFLAGIEFTEKELEALKEATLAELHNATRKKASESDKSVRKSFWNAAWEKIKEQFPSESPVIPFAKEFWDRYSSEISFGLNGMIKAMIVPDDMQADPSIRGRESWLANENNFGRIKNMTQEGRILAVTGDLLDLDKIDKLASYLKYAQLNISVVYISNIEEKLKKEDVEILNRNIRNLPLYNNAIVLKHSWRAGSSVTESAPAKSSSAGMAIESLRGSLESLLREIQSNPNNLYFSKNFNKYGLIIYDSTLPESETDREYVIRIIKLLASLKNFRGDNMFEIRVVPSQDDRNLIGSIENVVTIDNLNVEDAANALRVTMPVGILAGEDAGNISSLAINMHDTRDKRSQKHVFIVAPDVAENAIRFEVMLANMLDKFNRYDDIKAELDAINSELTGHERIQRLLSIICETLPPITEAEFTDMVQTLRNAMDAVAKAA